MLSKKVKYAIKALILLGKNSDVELNASKIADTERIPKKSLDVILIELKNAGYLQSRKELMAVIHFASLRNKSQWTKL